MTLDDRSGGKLAVVRRQAIQRFVNQDGSTENAGRENDGPSKSRGMKMGALELDSMLRRLRN